MDLKPETLEKIEALIQRYPEKRSAALPLLHLVQEEQGYISDAAIHWIAQKLELQPICIHELVSFYPMLRQQPIGRKHIKVCRTLSCALAGAYQVCETLQSEFDCELGHTSSDGNYTIDFVECLASCGTAPVVQVGEDLHEKVSPDKVVELINKIRSEGSDQSTHPQASEQISHN